MAQILRKLVRVVLEDLTALTTLRVGMVLKLSNSFFAYIPTNRAFDCNRVWDIIHEIHSLVSNSGGVVAGRGEAMNCRDCIIGARRRCKMLIGLAFLSVVGTPSYANTLAQNDALIIAGVVEKFKSIGLEIQGVGGSIADLNDTSPETRGTLTCFLLLQQDISILADKLNEAMMTTAVSSKMKSPEDERTVNIALTQNLSLIFKILPGMKKHIFTISGTCFRYAVVMAEAQKALAAIDATESQVGPIAARLGVTH